MLTRLEEAVRLPAINWQHLVWDASELIGGIPDYAPVEGADGAISWVCPGVYLRDVALPTMRAAAQEAGLPAPPLIAHAPVCVHENAQEVRAAAREQLANYPWLPFYQRMLVDAGFPEVSQGAWSDRMIEATVLSGDEGLVAERLQELFSFGATEILVSPISAGRNRTASIERTLRLLGHVAQSSAA